MRLWLYFFGVGLSVSNIADAVEPSPIGIWKTLDDHNGEVRALIEISEQDGALSGRVMQLFRKPGEDPNPRCEDCAGERHNQPVLGMTILWGLKKNADVWDGGKILDPDNGDIYRCRLHLETGGSKLEVRGYIGFSLLGRTQVWERQTP